MATMSRAVVTSVMATWFALLCEMPVVFYDCLVQPSIQIKHDVFSPYIITQRSAILTVVLTIFKKEKAAAPFGGKL